MESKSNESEMTKAKFYEIELTPPKQNEIYGKGGVPISAQQNWKKLFLER